jgi:SAM-dependent methyltransferase
VINWKIRYATILERYPELFHPERRILEVGSGNEGLARYVTRDVVGVDRVFAGSVNRHLAPVRGSVLGLPFADGGFDDVLCVDTLEHLPRGDRLRAVRELLRVARKRVIISGPAGAYAAWGDMAFLHEMSQRRGSTPGWLQEHVQHGIPSLPELLELLVATERVFTVQANEGVIQHYSGLFADNHPFMAMFLEMHEEKFPLDAPLQRARGDAPYSYLVTIDTAARVAAPTEPPPQPEGAVPLPAQPGRTALFAVGHRLDRMPEIRGVRRMLAGAASHEAELGPDMLRDDAGDTIADRNATFSEMTAIYSVWKNVTGLDCVGFCHYRRFFDFRQPAWPSPRETRLRSPHEVQSHEAHFVDRAVIDRVLKEGAIVVTRTTNERVANAEQYMMAHVADHYLAMVNYVLTHYRRLARQVIAHVGDHGFCGNNMFVMRWSDFDRLCEFWFDCLFALDREIGDKPEGYQHRVLAFLSERIFDIHVRWLRDSGRRVLEYPLFFLEDPAFG